MIGCSGPRISVACHEHVFVPHKSEEHICRSCGFVIWSVTSVEEGNIALRELGGGACPGTWHGKQKPFTKGIETWDAGTKPVD
jgi:hypothetical protein